MHMYLLLIVGLIVFFVVAGMGFPGGWAIGLIDLTSLLMLLFISIPILLISGLGKDFLNAFRLFFGKKKQSGLVEKKKAVEAMDLMMKALIYSGIFIVIVQFVGLGFSLESFDREILVPNLMVLPIPLFYSLILDLLLLPIKGRLSKESIDHMEVIDEEEEKVEE